MSATANALAMAARQTGVRADEMHGFEAKMARATLGQLFRKGKLVRVQVNHWHSRFFLRQTDADKFSEQIRVEREAEAKRTNYNRAVGSKAKPAPRVWPADAPVVYAPDFKFTLCPSHLPPLSEQVLPNVYGGNQRGRVSA